MSAQSKPDQCSLLLLFLSAPQHSPPPRRQVLQVGSVATPLVRGGDATSRVLTWPSGTMAQTALVLAVNLSHLHHSTGSCLHFPPSLPAHAGVSGVMPGSKLLHHLKSQCSLQPLNLVCPPGGSSPETHILVFMLPWSLCTGVPFARKACFLPPCLTSAQVFPPPGSPPTHLGSSKSSFPYTPPAPGYPIKMTYAVFCLPHCPRTLEGRDSCSRPCSWCPGPAPARSKCPWVSRWTELYAFAWAAVTEYHRPLATEAYCLTVLEVGGLRPR